LVSFWMVKMQLFNQSPPQLGNQYDQDRLLGSYLRRTLPPDILRDVQPKLREMGEMAGGELYEKQLDGRLDEPRLVQWDAWGERVDRIEVTPLWKQAERLAAEFGLVAAAYEEPYGPYARTMQFALVYLFHPSTDFYTCPLAMTDGAARTLQHSGNQELIDRALPRLTSRDPLRFWTSGQWMTETSGGSDVGRSLTAAVRGEDGHWRLYGRKWFTSAVTSQMALALARPEGNPPGGHGLALFYLELRDEQGRLNNTRINRLKDKLGTRKLPTAELELDGAIAVPVMGLDNGVRTIIPMLHLTRTWNSVTAASTMRRGVALARDYAQRRAVFGAPLAEQPLHIDTLAGLQAETEAAFHLSFYLVRLLGAEEAGSPGPGDQALLRLLTSIAKLTTGRQAVAVAAEVVEAHGGAGYVEDTGLPLLLRDSQVFPIWEGTTNVLALDVLRALALDANALPALREKVTGIVNTVDDMRLIAAAQTANESLSAAISWYERTRDDRTALEAGARRFAMTLGRALALALLVEHAGWSLYSENDGRALATARRFAQSGINLLYDSHTAESSALANDTPVGG
jgi:alkylation response protein AidB-like acyl-CoA dehydrogenase